MHFYLQECIFFCNFARFLGKSQQKQKIYSIMRNKHFFLLAAAIIMAVSAFAAIPANYYNNVEGQKTPDNILKTLCSIIDDHTVIDYKSLEPYYERTDFYADTLWDMYSTCRFTMAEANVAQKKLCDGWNKEHVVCQSWFNSSDIYSDLFNVYPTDARVNNLRSSYPYGVVETNKGFSNDPDHHALGKLGTSAISGGGSVVYEPDDQYKGDFARTYFYAVARYRNDALNKGNGSVMFTSNPTNLTSYSLSFLLKWHREDPVSQKEINRNDSVYAIQKNRNPFIDYPYLVEYIWGDLKNQKVAFAQMISSQDPDFIPGVSSGKVESTDPLLACSTSELTFPTLLKGEEATLPLTFQGARLTNGVTLNISGADAAMFSLNKSSFTLAEMEQNSKPTIEITYKPTSNAIHKAVLTIASEGANTLAINLSGACAVEAQLLWIANCEEYNAGDPDKALAVGSQIQNIPTAPVSCSATSTQFVGWSQTAINGTTDDVPADLFSDASEAPVVNGNMTFYAVFARVTESGGGEAENITWTKDSGAGWTETGLKESGANRIFVTGASLTSPEIDYSALESVSFYIRTFGGTQYNIIDIYAGSTKIGSVDAVDKNMKTVEWKNDKTLTGKGSLVFSSSTNTKDNGPAAQSITIKSAGIKYIYDQYLTSCKDCDTPTNTESIEIVPAVHKFIFNGQLFIEADGHIYNIFGQEVL